MILTGRTNTESAVVFSVGIFLRIKKVERPTHTSELTAFANLNYGGNSMEKQFVKMTINGQPYQFMVGEGFGMIPPSETLVQTLRQRLELTGTKESCDEGACGCCTVIKDGNAIASCMILTVECDGSEITTIEGLEALEKDGFRAAVMDAIDACIQKSKML